MSDDDGNVFHYPPELTQLLVQTIPLLCRTKPDVLLFFRGCGMTDADMATVTDAYNQDPQAARKHPMTRDLLVTLNTSGDRLLRARRELVRRVAQFEDFSSCWENDQLKAKGLVAEVRRVVNIKDSFTRMADVAEEQRLERARVAREAAAAAEKRRENLRNLRTQFLALFAERDPQRRGKRLEPVMNGIFTHFGISFRDSFVRRDEPTGRVVEQIDGVVELDGHLYLVEMKWLKDKVSVEDVSTHLVRAYHRHGARAVFISDTEFSPGALQTCKEALQQTVVTLVSLEELVWLLEQESDLKDLLRRKVSRAVVDKEPWIKLRPG